MHDARNSYAQYVPIGYRLLGRYLDKAYNSVPEGLGPNPPHGISNSVRWVYVLGVALWCVFPTGENVDGGVGGVRGCGVCAGDCMFHGA
jgi:hypothetical protein